MDWYEIWERKGSAVIGTYDHESLIALDGFDVGAGRLTSRQFFEIARLVQRELGLQPGMRLLDVGCGGGALLWCFRGSGIRLFGTDYSKSLIGHARRAIPEASFAVGEAVNLPFEVDAIVCHSVFQYFPDADYAVRVLAEFRRVSRVALVLDIPDLATRDASERARDAAGSKPAEHLYYPRSFFQGRTWSQVIEKYANAPFRFNALLPGQGSPADWGPA